MRDKDKKSQKVVANSLVLVLQLSLNMVIPIMLCTVVCYFISEKTGNRYITIIGIIVGIIAGINGVYRQVIGYTKNEESPGQKARRLEKEKLNDNKMDKKAQ